MTEPSELRGRPSLYEACVDGSEVISREEAWQAMEAARREHFRRNVHSKAVAFEQARDIIRDLPSPSVPEPPNPTVNHLCSDPRCADPTHMEVSHDWQAGVLAVRTWAAKELAARDAEIDELKNQLLGAPEPPNDAKTLNEMMAEVVEFEHSKGWQPNDNRFLESLALLHSEISEALEAYRDKDWGSIRESDGKPEGVTSELADTFIRLLSTWAQFLSPLGHSLEEQYELKMAYNRTRPWKHGGRTI